MAVPPTRTLRLITGVLLLLAGFASIVFPFLSAAAVTVTFGAVAVVAGVDVAKAVSVQSAAATNPVKVVKPPQP